MSPVAIAWLIGIGVVMLVGWIVVVGLRKERERTEALQGVATAAGLAFQPRGDLGMVASLGDLPLYAHGHSKRVKNLMTGRVGDDETAVFDYQYTTGGGKHQHTSVQTVVVFPRASPSLPDFQLAPENLFHKIGQAFGYQDIDFDSNPEFSRAYLVRGRDEDAIRTALYPQALSYFMEHEGWTVEVRSGTVGIYHAGRRLRVEEVRSFVEEAREVLRSIRR
jgi:hypothetical protein